MASDLPESLSAPALRALQNAGITTLAELARYDEAEIADLHGMGPGGIRLLKAALRELGRANARPSAAIPLAQKKEGRSSRH